MPANACFESPAILAAVPGSPADWALRAAAHVQGDMPTKAFATRLHHATNLLLDEGRAAEAERVLPALAKALGVVEPGRYLTPSLLLVYVEARLAGGEPKVPAHAGKYEVLNGWGFPEQMTKYAGLEGYLPEGVWNAFVPVMSAVRAGDKARMKRFVGPAVAVLVNHKLPDEEYQAAAFPFAAGHLFFAASLVGDGRAADELETRFEIAPEFAVAGRLGLDVKRAAKAAELATKATVEELKSSGPNKHNVLRQFLSRTVRILLAHDEKALAAETLAPVSKTVHSLEMIGGIRASVHATLAADLAAADDAKAAEEHLAVAREIAPGLSFPPDKQAALTQIANAYAKMGDFEAALAAAKKVSHPFTRQACLATLLLESGDAAAAAKVADTAVKTPEGRAALCEACQAQASAGKPHLILAGLV